MEKNICGDCGAEEGSLHQGGCDMERCPVCGNQYISCGCRWKDKDKKPRVPYIEFPLVCGRCGMLWPDLFMVPNNEWKRYIPIAHRDIILCRPCYDEIRNLIDGVEDD